MLDKDLVISRTDRQYDMAIRNIVSFIMDTIVIPLKVRLVAMDTIVIPIKVRLVVFVYFHTFPTGSGDRSF